MQPIFIQATPYLMVTHAAHPGDLSGDGLNLKEELIPLQKMTRETTDDTQTETDITENR